jgi:toxin YoeB
MDIEFSQFSWEEFVYWIENGKEMVNKIKQLISSIMEDPFKGIGKPEPLKYGFKDFLVKENIH